MKLFGKIISEKIKAELLGRFGMVVVTGLSVLLVGIFSFAWFSRNTTSGGSGMELVVHTEGYEILVDRTTAFDSSGDYPSIAPAGMTKDQLSAAGYDLVSTRTGEAPKIAYELVNEDLVDGKYNLMPGSYGTLTFYLKPVSDERVSLDFTIELGAFGIEYDEGDNEVLREVSNSTVLDLLVGHLLFFTERTPAKAEADEARSSDVSLNSDEFVYGGFIADGTFSYDTDGHTAISGTGTDKDGCYEITVYWEWPLTYSNIFYSSVENEQTVYKFPAGTRAYVADTDNYDHFFIYVGDEADDTVKEGLYNDADQLIGTAVDAIAVYVTVK